MTEIHSPKHLTSDDLNRLAEGIWEAIDRSVGDHHYWTCGAQGDRFYHARELCDEQGIDLNQVIALVPSECECEMFFNISDFVDNTKTL